MDLRLLYTGLLIGILLPVLSANWDVLAVVSQSSSAGIIQNSIISSYYRTVRV